MKHCFTSVLLICIAAYACGQSGRSLIKLKMEFSPSFMSASQVIFQNQDSNTVQLNVYKNYREHQYSLEAKAPVPVRGIKLLTDFFTTYKYQITDNITSRDIIQKRPGGKTDTIHQISSGTDGINVKGEVYENNLIHRFAFWSPEKGTPNAKLMQIIFKLLYQSFSDTTAVNYIASLEDYFPHKLRISKLSDNPLTYKLYGALTSNEADELRKFLSSLPLNRKILIDLSSFTGMGTMFYDDFKTYGTEKHIFWLHPSKAGLIQLNKMGMPESQIISDR